MRKAGLPLQRLLGGDTLLTIARDLHLVDVAALYAAIGENHVSAQNVVQRIVAHLGGPEGAVEDLAEAIRPTERPRDATSRRRGGDAGVMVKDVTDIWVKLAPLLHTGAR